MTTIHKYAIMCAWYQALSIPEQARIIHAGCDPNGIPCVWALVDNEPSAHRIVHLCMVPTGGEVPEGTITRHISTFIVQQDLVFHLFEYSEKPLDPVLS